MEADKRMEGEEISLIDYVKVMIKRKKIILATFLVTVVAVTIISMLMNKVYKIESVIEVGMTSADSTIENPEQVLQGVKRDLYGAAVRSKLGISERDYPKIKVTNSTGTNLIAFEINSDRVEQSENVLREIENLIINNHQERVSDEKKLLESSIELKKKDIETESKDIERVKSEIGFLEEEKNNLEAKVEALQKVLVYRLDAGSQFALFDTKEKLALKKNEIEESHMEVNSLESSINAINGEINSLEKQISDIRMTRAVKDPVVSEKIVSPNIISNLIIAAVLGIFAGVFLAFGSEWWEKNKGYLKDV